MRKRVLAVLAVVALAACGLDATGLAPAEIADDGSVASSGAGGATDIDGGATSSDPSDDGGTDGGGTTDADAAVITAGSALELDGDDYVEVGALAIPADFTLEAWVRPKTASGETYVVAKDRSGQGDGQFRLGLENGGRLFFMMTASDGDDHGLYQGNYALRFAAALPMNAWTHVAVTKSGADFTLYAGAATPVTKMADAAFVHSGSVAFRIGGRVAPDGSGLSGGFVGIIDDVRMWNVARSAAEIAATRAAPPSLATPGLVTYFRFDEGMGATTTDAKGALVGTLLGPPAWVASTAF